MPDSQPQLGRTSLRCRDFLDTHAEYVDGLLSSAETQAFDAHAAACRRCGHYDRVVRRGLLLARNVPEIQPSPHFHDNLASRLLVVDSEATRPLLPNGATAAVVGVVLVLIAATPLIRLAEDEQGAAPPAPQVQLLPGSTSAAVLVRGAENAKFTPVVVQPPALQPMPSAPRLIAYPLQSAEDR